MPDTEPSGAQKMFGDFAPALVHFTDGVLFGEACLQGRRIILLASAAEAHEGATDDVADQRCSSRGLGVAGRC